MAGSSWSVQDAKNQFSAVIKAAKRAPQTVTKHGKPAVVIVAAEEFAKLQRAERVGAPNFVEHLLSMPADGGVFERMPGRLRDVDA